MSARLKTVALTLAVVLAAVAAYQLFALSHRMDRFETQVRQGAISSTSKEIMDYVKRVVATDHAQRVVTFDEFSKSYGPALLETPCLDAALPSIRRDFPNLDEAFDDCKAEIAKAIGRTNETLDEPALYAIMAAIVASRLAPYGNSKAFTTEEILASPALNCAQHARFVTFALQRRYGDTIEVEAIGLNGGVVGNHIIVSVQTPQTALVVDGTTSVVAFANFEDIVAGRLLSPEDIRDFYTLNDEAIEVLRRSVRGALRFGAIRPEHIIYRTAAKDFVRR